METCQTTLYQGQFPPSVRTPEDCRSTDLPAVWVEVWFVCAGQDKTPGETLTGVPGTAGLSWDTDQEDSTTLESEDEQIQTITTKWDTTVT